MGSRSICMQYLMTSRWRSSPADMSDEEVDAGMLVSSVITQTSPSTPSSEHQHITALTDAAQRTRCHGREGDNRKQWKEISKLRRTVGVVMREHDVSGIPCKDYTTRNTKSNTDPDPIVGHGSIFADPIQSNPKNSWY